MCVFTVRRSLQGCDTHFASERRGMSTCIFRTDVIHAGLAGNLMAEKVPLIFAAQPLQSSAGSLCWAEVHFAWGEKMMAAKCFKPIKK